MSVPRRSPPVSTLVTMVLVVLCAAYVAAYLNAGGLALALPLFVVLCWPVVVLGRRPVLALLLVLVLGALLTPLIDPQVVTPVASVATLVAVARLAVDRSWRFSLPGAVGSLVVLTLLMFAFFVRGGGSPLGGVGTLTLAMMCVWTVGNSVRQSRQNAAARRAEETDRAVAAERLRIARELHDLVAHSMGVIAFQAGAGRRVIETRPVEARDALDAIETTSREALAELRRTLSALRRSDPEGAPSAPTPGLADLDRLVATAADAGVRVVVSRTGTARHLPADLDLSAYRIIQEAVTNVVRHAGTDHCRVLLEHHDDTLSIEVLDDGPGTGASGTGYGLVGMRERVTLLGGWFEAGPRPEGGFRVLARIPVHD